MFFDTGGLLIFSNEWVDILNQVNKFSKTTAWFRGHGSHEYKLNSGLFRLELKDLKAYKNAEVILYRKFLNLGHLHHNESDWNLLYIMQHHGVITRLLDWSESFGAALFFAYNEWKRGEKASVWMLHPTDLNMLSVGKTQYKMPRETETYEDLLFNYKFEDSSVALFPLRNSDRMVAQQGVFTLQGNSMVPLDQEHGGVLVDSGDLVEIVLTESLREDVTKYLQLSGINHYTLFPDLDGLAKEVNRTFRKPDLVSIKQ